MITKYMISSNSYQVQCFCNYTYAHKYTHKCTHKYTHKHTHIQTGVRDLWADLLGANIHVQKPLTGQFWKYMLVLRVKICLY